MESLRTKIGMQIRRLRERNGLSQEELSSLAKIERSNLSKVENGKMNISIDVLERILVALNVTIDINE